MFSVRKKGTGLKKYTTAGGGGGDKYELGALSILTLYKNMFTINVDLMVVAMDTSVVTTMVIVAQKFEQCGDSKLNQPVPTETPPCPSPQRKYTQNTKTNANTTK